MTHLEKLANDAQDKLIKLLERADYSEANEVQGYRDGITHFDNKGEKENAEIGFKAALKNKDFGRAAYWRAYHNGIERAETAHRLDELEAM